ncbi:MAG: mercuric transporter MerT family protein [candidate division KSB1 bacterium]|nr:mercuric transporter MerT family protein [candidate division KSB1 bacterium]MDZ7274224.1 mercuric transporter MerT family protein [candidate division KSB1 bacterium]MDZ7287254.1 mercuric transporter MerT family protein [candidate division KSB1 bacterium]MDZ7296822.1 mercuric transporter MerT family protein [candidate division KSB1 bacterium]MDZ7347688.1 mercuric transporter MerT family protein [candidate division KSB1 bacterium]
MQKTALSTVGSVVTAIFASLCCIGPAVLAIVGAGSLSAFAAFEKYRLYFIGITAVLLGAAFYLTYRKRPDESGKCEDGSCKIEGAGKWNKIGVWSATIIAALAIAYPYLAMKPSPANNTAFAPKANVVLKIEGMTCNACATRIQDTLSDIKGVHSVSVEQETKKARVAYDSSLVAPDVLVNRVNEIGYTAMLSQKKGE